MAQDLTKLVPKLLAQGLLALRQQSVMSRLVNRAYEREAGRKGSTVDVPVPSAVTANNVTPGATSQTPSDLNPTTIPLALDQWKEAAFVLTDKEQMEVMDGVIPMSASEAIKALANVIDNHILSFYTGIYSAVGVPGTTPFGTDVTEYLDARKELNKTLAPFGDRRCVIDPDAEAKALALRAFQDASFGGGSGVILDGNINQKLGARWFLDQNIPTHTAGTLTGTIDVSGAHAVGVTSILLATGAGEAIALKKGDIITFAGDPQTYAAGADLTVGASSSGSLIITPGLKVALSGAEVVSVKATHAVNLLFHRDAFAFASRPLAQSTHPNALISSAVDPISQVALRLEVTREHKRDRWSYDVLYGAALIRAELGARIMG